VTRVAVTGMGVIGKRVAHAVALHPGLTLAGIAVRSAGPAVLAQPELPYYASCPGAQAGFAKAGVALHGDLRMLLASADLAVDCGPAGTGASRAATYRTAGVQAIFCGGERDPSLGALVHPAVAGSLPAAASYRMTSCNTTALIRLATCLGRPELTRLDALVLRCCTDTDKAGKGITNGAVLGASPTHHAHDLQALMPKVRFASAAATLPMTCGHVIHVRMEFGRPPAPGLLQALGSRILCLPPGTVSTAGLRAQMARTGRRWHDRYEVVAVPVAVCEGQRAASCWLALDNQAVTIPEMLDLLQILGGTDPRAASASTDAVLGIPTPVLSGSGDALRPVPAGRWS
jgi:glyceraldehyde-3-phosphate dehydrogenase (NAD(P)+) (phosphorylating)